MEWVDHGNGSVSIDLGGDGWIDGRRMEDGTRAIAWIDGKDKPSIVTAGCLRDGDGSEDLIVAVTGTAEDIRRFADLLGVVPACDAIDGLPGIVQAAALVVPSP